jgi:hypothetical protein
MQDGTVITEQADSFSRFADLVLGFRADPDVARLTWAVEGKETL